MTVTNIVRQDQVEADMGLASSDALEARDVEYEER
jgi:hypothetical protein